VAVARYAMATRFEIVLHGPDPVSLRAAAEEALDEIERLEQRLSFYRSSSDIGRINAQGFTTPVRVDPRTFLLIERAQRLHAATGGTLDVTVGPLLQCWGLAGGAGRIPSARERAAALERMGPHRIVLDPQARTVGLDRPGVSLDFGAIGKGCAVESAAEILREAGVKSALLHGGTSTIYAIGAPPGAERWTVAVQDPDGPPGASGRPALLATIDLKDEALSVSTVSGKAFTLEGRTYGHVLDPRTGEPVTNAVLAAVALSSATEADAFSTALLVGGEETAALLTAAHPEARLLLLRPEGREPRIRAIGFALMKS
jgi:FAD:protein FMN transferase